MNYILNEKWDNVVDFDKCEFDQIMQNVENEYVNNNVTPAFEDIFNAFKYTDYDKVKVVLLGQDPYPQKDVAHGLSFSSLTSTSQSSLNRIYKKMEEETGYKVANRKSCDLRYLTEQGVLLLNVALTCEVDKRGSHLNNMGWKKFTNHIIDLLDERGDCVFLLFGEPAQLVGKRITNSVKVEGPHPISSTPGKIFREGEYFTLTNKKLKSMGIEPIKWTDTEYNEYLSK